MGGERISRIDREQANWQAAVTSSRLPHGRAEAPCRPALPSPPLPYSLIPLLNKGGFPGKLSRLPSVDLLQGKATTAPCPAALPCFSCPAPLRPASPRQVGHHPRLQARAGVRVLGTRASRHERCGGVGAGAAGSGPRRLRPLVGARWPRGCAYLAFCPPPPSQPMVATHGCTLATAAHALPSPVSAHPTPPHP